MRSAKDRVQQLEKEKEQVQQRYSETAAELSETKEKLDSQARAAETSGMENEELRLKNASMLQQLATLENESSELKSELSALRKGMGESRESQLEQLCQISKEADVLRRQLSDMEILRKRAEQAESQVKRLKSDLFDMHGDRKKLHNTIMELKGNIRVYVRVRPFLPHDGDSSAAAIQCAPDGKALEILAAKGTDGTAGLATSKFKFDHVHGLNSTQQEVFEVSAVALTAGSRASMTCWRLRSLLDLSMRYRK